MDVDAAYKAGMQEVFDADLSSADIAALEAHYQAVDAILKGGKAKGAMLIQ